MNTAVFDSRDLNSLFDNQKKLDDLFDSIFDDDNFFITGTIATAEVGSGAASNEFYSPSSQSVLAIETLSKDKSYIYSVTLVLELAAIYFVMRNLW